jgi:DNA-binding transcriptional MerR regulator
VSAPNPGTTLSIKEAAAESGVSAHTLRYYERIGLLPAVQRDANGQRRYSRWDLGAISILMRLRATGMPIQGMRRFAALLAVGDDAMSERRALLEAHGQSVRERILELETNLTAIAAKIALYTRLENERAPSSSPPPSSRDDARAIAQEV